MSQQDRDQTLTSGAPEAGGATTRGSSFGGRGISSMFFRAVARAARAIEAAAYRRLRDMDAGAGQREGSGGRPNRVHEASQFGRGQAPSPF